MDKNIAVMAVLITAWAVTAMDYPYKEKGGKPAGSSVLWLLEGKGLSPFFFILLK